MSVKHSKALHALVLALGCSIAAASAAAAAADSGPLIGNPLTVLPKSAPGGAVVLFSDAAGWGAQEQEAAKALAEQGFAVMGVDLAATLKRMAVRKDACVTLIGEIEALSHRLQRQAGTQRYHFPVLAGVQAGGAMALGVAGQAGAATIARVVAVDAPARLPAGKPMCGGTVEQGSYRLPPPPLPYGVELHLSAQAEPADRAYAVTLARGRQDVHVAASNAAPWVVLQQAIVGGHGADGHAANDALADLPLIELPVEQGGDTFAVLYSGDGGWRDLDKDVAALLQRDGLSVVGVDVLRYFWSRRSPEQSAHDLARIIQTYQAKWGARRVALIGFSFGADVMPALYNRLPAALRASVVQVSLLGFSASADFEVTVSGWLERQQSDALPTLPEAARIDPRRLQCFYGQDDDEAACTLLDRRAEIVRTTGGHHFDGDYEALARRILSGLKLRETL
ncbi:type IV secretory pathway VirJ component [Azoarcus indigens]|uniref:Type IV secretory pathway VirJ component n=1 Tax=Azoarcus indigens TaxID=29545 RepID=A0A4R6DQ87_9RHOO|nr:type IV secretory pathway VirJ component [Azoarcus indigens]